MAKARRSSARLGKEEWLYRALEILARTGGSRLRIDTLVEALGVTKGSFYWHFKNRADFVQCVVDYWDRRFTRVVPETIGEDPAPASERLMHLMELVHDQGLTRFDVVVRAWATYDPQVATKVRDVDRFRMRYVRSLFEEMGFAGTDLDVRTRAFVTFMSLEAGLFERLSKKERKAQLRARHAFFTRP
jgi:AcrR family transcriptional regulator